MIKRQICLLFCMVGCLWLAAANAHQQKEAYTTILFNKRTGNLEVSHRFLIHDAEHVLNRLFEEKSDLVGDAQTRTRFANYILSNFKLADAQEQALKLATVGNEIEGKYFWVYQETKIPETSALAIKHTSLQEVWPTQTNHINVEKDGWVRSARLKKKHADQWYKISLTANP